METRERRAKVTPETVKEAKVLRAMWEERGRTPSQGTLGEDYDIGGQSVVGQFLRGETPLSLKAAKGFAKAFSCKIEDFSPRLARKAAEIADMAPPDALSADVVNLAREIDALKGRERTYVLRMCREALKFVRGEGRQDGEARQSGNG